MLIVKFLNNSWFKILFLLVIIGIAGYYFYDKEMKYQEELADKQYQEQKQKDDLSKRLNNTKPLVLPSQTQPQPVNVYVQPKASPYQDYMRDSQLRQLNFNLEQMNRQNQLNNYQPVQLDIPHL